MRKENLYFSIFILVALLATAIVVCFFPRTKVWEPSGRLYLSLVSNNFSDQNDVPTKIPPVGIYRFDLKSKKLEKLFSDSMDANDMTVRFSPDGKKAAFVSNRHDPDKGYDEIYTMDADYSNIQRLTHSDITDKQLPTWSPDSQFLAYTTFTDSVSPGSASVRLVDLNGNDRFLTWGAYPLFTPDGKQVLVLKDEGLFLVNIDDGNLEGPVLDIYDICGGRECKLNVKINLSSDKKLLVWTDSFQRKIGIFRIDDWTSFKTVPLKNIDSIVAFWPVFSPDNKYLAVQEVEIMDGEVKKISLVVYNLDALEKQILVDLNQYRPDYIWLTDWRK